MAKRTCEHGHIYDSSIYGDKCPFCPGGEKTIFEQNSGGNTVVNDGGDDPKYDDGGTSSTSTGKTEVYDGGDMGGGTMIFSKDAGGRTKTSNNRRLMGFLVSYETPNGEAYNIYEGRNSVGSDPRSDIRIAVNGVSRNHLTILCSPYDHRFILKDEMSTNGTFVGDKFVNADTIELKDHDIIKIGGATLIFIVIPQII